jgi:hypothetical protein
VAASNSPARPLDFNQLMLFSFLKGSERRGAGFAGADPHGVCDVDDEDLAVANLAS